MSRTNTNDVEAELIRQLAVSPCGISDAPTLISLVDVAEDLVMDALHRLVGIGDVEPVGVAYRITDAGWRRVNGGRS